MRNVVLRFLTFSLIFLVFFSACEKELTRVVKKHYPNGQEKFVLYYNGEPSQETWVRAELYHDNGQLMTIKRYEKGIQNGYTESFYENGAEMAKVMYKNGEKIGHYWKKHKNGQIAYTGDYKQNKRNGEWVKIAESGDTIRIEKYEIGKLLGSKHFDKKE